MKTIHIFRTADVDSDLFTSVVDLLASVPGPLKFRANTDFAPPLPQNHAMPNEVSWRTIFNICNDYRRNFLIQSEDFVITLTGVRNDENWFSALDQENPKNGFVHTDDWRMYINCSEAFPVAYETLSLVLQRYIFRGAIDWNVPHVQPIGCMNDMCAHKKDVILKLRTADICQECLERLDGEVSPPELDHFLGIMDSLRERMLFAQNFRQSRPPSGLLVDAKKRVFLTDYGNIEIKMPPLHKTLYLLFLRHPKGILLSDLFEYKSELIKIYFEVTGVSPGQGQEDRMVEMRSSIEEMTNITSNSASQKISKIKALFEEAIGKELAKHYYIKGATGERKSISLDRGLLRFE